MAGIGVQEGNPEIRGRNASSNTYRSSIIVGQSLNNWLPITDGLEAYAIASRMRGKRSTSAALMLPSHATDINLVLLNFSQGSGSEVVV